MTNAWRYRGDRAGHAVRAEPRRDRAGASRARAAHAAYAARGKSLAPR
ncbi:hypothetical protein [Streptomyces sp. NPDC053560]